MAEFLTTTGTSAELEKIIRNAREKIIICSPFLKISKLFYERLIEADNREVKINILYGKSELSDDEQDKIESLENVRLFYFQDLHAKCYGNEESLIITSMNFYEFSQVNNREMGILVHKKDDEKLYNDAIDELNAIAQNSDHYMGDDDWDEDDDDSYFSDEPVNQKLVFKKGDPSKGFCLRCGEEIPFNCFQPYCRSHFKSWSYWQNPDFEEKYCHRCGSKTSSTMNKPLCYECFKER